MKQLTGLDVTFLAMESASQFGHVSSLSIYERPGDGYDPFDAWRAQIERRLHLLEPLTRRLVEVPFNIDHPFWVDDPDFDLDFHVRHTAVPPPGGDAELSELVARIIGRPLDRARPLWETYVIEGLPENRFGILTKVHHATVDGASGVELLTLMLDQEPGGDPIVVPDDAVRRPERLPTDTELVMRATANLVRKPARGLLLTARALRELGEATRNPALVAIARQWRQSLRGPLGTVLNIGRNREEERDPPPPLPNLRAPRTPFNASISPHRRFAMRSTSLDTIKAIKNASGATVNDVVMAVCSGALRCYLDERDALPAEPLVAMIPVSIRTGEETEKWTNRVSGLLALLPTDEPEPLARLQRVHDAMVAGKQLFDAIPAETLTNFSEFPSPALFARATRMATRLRLSERLAPLNLVISNVPGPRHPLYAAGARLLHYYPVSTIVDGQGLNITVQSYLDVLDFGLVACRELVPDLEHLADLIVEEIDVLAELTGVAAGQPQ
ncbi:MAG: WS/DGAT/MGAT family O-acyltransferase [Actinomycetota bacterium]